MEPRYDDVSTKRRARLSSDAKEQRKVFEQAYDVALELITLREQHGLTQAELAERCGIDQGDISRIERGVLAPTTPTLLRLAEGLNARITLDLLPT